MSDLQFWSIMFVGYCLGVATMAVLDLLFKKK